MASMVCLWRKLSISPVFVKLCSDHTAESHQLRVPFSSITTGRPEANVPGGAGGAVGTSRRTRDEMKGQRLFRKR